MAAASESACSAKGSIVSALPLPPASDGGSWRTPGMTASATTTAAPSAWLTSSRRTCTFAPRKGGALARITTSPVTSGAADPAPVAASLPTRRGLSWLRGGGRHPGRGVLLGPGQLRVDELHRGDIALAQPLPLADRLASFRSNRRLPVHTEGSGRVVHDRAVVVAAEV